MDELDIQLNTWWNNYTATTDQEEAGKFDMATLGFYTASSYGGEFLDSVQSNPDYFQNTLHTILDYNSGLESISRSRLLHFVYEIDISTADSILDSHVSIITYDTSVRVTASTYRLRENWATSKYLLLGADYFEPFNSISWSDSVESSIDSIITFGVAESNYLAAQYYNSRDTTATELLIVAKAIMDTTDTSGNLVYYQTKALDFIYENDSTNFLTYASKGLENSEYGVQETSILAIAQLAYGDCEAALDSLEDVAENHDDYRIRDIAAASVGEVNGDHEVIPQRDPDNLRGGYRVQRALDAIRIWTNDDGGNRIPSWVWRPGETLNQTARSKITAHEAAYGSIAAHTNNWYNAGAVMTAVINEGRARICGTAPGILLCNMPDHEIRDNLGYNELSKDYAKVWRLGSKCAADDSYHRYFDGPNEESGGGLADALIREECVIDLYKVGGTHFTYGATEWRVNQKPAGATLGDIVVLKFNHTANNDGVWYWYFMISRVGDELEEWDNGWDNHNDYNEGYMLIGFQKTRGLYNEGPGALWAELKVRAEGDSDNNWKWTIFHINPSCSLPDGCTFHPRDHSNITPQDTGVEK